MPFVFDPAYYTANGYGKGKPLTGLGSGDSFVEFDAISECTFEELRDEIDWQTMGHRGGVVPRLISVQGEVSAEADIEPLYRHPADEQPPLIPFTPHVDAIRRVVSERIGQELNHVLVQMYRSGVDYISEHADKTLDIVRGSAIVNVSIGASREMIVRPKRSAMGTAAERLKRKQRICLPHGSLFVMGWNTNELMTHEIKQDKRDLSEKRADELRNEGYRISLTFRTVGTFRRRRDNRIFGQGARYKTEAELDGTSVVDDADALLIAFGKENSSSPFDWDAVYGAGFDAIHTSLS